MCNCLASVCVVCTNVHVHENVACKPFLVCVHFEKTSSECGANSFMHMCIPLVMCVVIVAY